MTTCAGFCLSGYYKPAHLKENPCGLRFESLPRTWL